MLAEWEQLRERIQAVDRELVAEAQQHEACERLLEVPGSGAQTATALVAAVGDGKAFEKGRDLTAWLGLTPAEHSRGAGSVWEASASAATATGGHCWCIAPA